KTNGYTFCRIAEKMGIIPQTLHETLRRENVKLKQIERIAKAIDKDVTFFTDYGKPEIQHIEEIRVLYQETLKLYAAMLEVSKNINCSLLSIAQNSSSK